MIAEGTSIEMLLEEGYLPPRSLLSEEEAREILHHAIDARSRENLASRSQFKSTLSARLRRVLQLKQSRRRLKAPTSYYKSLHYFSSEIRSLARHPEILKILRKILGNEIILWGSCLVEKVPKQNHRWHRDVEHLRWPGLSVWIALENVNEMSFLRIARRSHQEQQLNNFEPIDESCVEIHPAVGDFVVFDGKTLHASINESTKPRMALLLQYTIPSSQIQIPLGFQDPLQWDSTVVLPVDLVSGGLDVVSPNYILDLQV